MLDIYNECNSKTLDPRSLVQFNSTLGNSLIYLMGYSGLLKSLAMLNGAR